MFKVRAVFLFTFAFLVCNVKSDSASGCCKSWYNQDQSCTECQSGFTCRNSILWDVNAGGLIEETSRTDCISYTMSESDCIAMLGVTYVAADDTLGIGCPANTSDSTLLVSTSSSAVTPTGLLGLLSACLVAFMLV